MFYTYDYQSQNWLCLKQDVYQPLFIPFLPSSKMGWCSVHKKWEPCIRTDKGKLYFVRKADPFSVCYYRKMDNLISRNRNK